jgi:hypothetical protein
MITLGDMADKGMTMLEVASRRCDRRGRLRIARLIAEHGRDDYGDLRRIIAADCPKMPVRGALSRAAALVLISPPRDPRRRACSRSAEGCDGRTNPARLRLNCASTCALLLRCTVV